MESVVHQGQIVEFVDDPNRRRAKIRIESCMIEVPLETLSDDAHLGDKVLIKATYSIHRNHQPVTSPE
ncbi:hypothetical protein K1X84_15215 [bacterium]|nr:hypothetical protein [bacterium]